METTRYRRMYPYEIKIRKKVEKAMKNKEKKMSPKERELLKDIESTYKEMITMFSHFDYVTEPELIEYYTYQYKAAQIKYDYLIRCLKSYRTPK